MNVTAKRNASKQILNTSILRGQASERTQQRILKRSSWCNRRKPEHCCILEAKGKCLKKQGVNSSLKAPLFWIKMPEQHGWWLWAFDKAFDGFDKAFKWCIGGKKCIGVDSREKERRKMETSLMGNSWRVWLQWERSMYVYLNVEVQIREALTFVCFLRWKLIYL